MSVPNQDAEIGTLVIASHASASPAPDPSLAFTAPDVLVAASRREVVFIADNVPDYASLAQAAGAGRQVVVLDSNRDGLAQMVEALAGQSGIDALHIISHGKSGALDLGALMLDASSLGEHEAQLQAIGRSMKPGGDILLYGCDVGAGDGAAFVERLAVVTGADVAASDDATGSAGKRGDWELEVVQGRVDASPVLGGETAALYQDVLGIPSVTVTFNDFSRVKDMGDLYLASRDTVYLVNGDPAYGLKTDGADVGTGQLNATHVFVMAAWAGQQESSLSLSFERGQLFTAESIALTGYNYVTQNLIIRGYDSSNTMVGTGVPATINGTIGMPQTISLAGIGGPIKTLKILATSNGGKIQTMFVDGLTLKNVGPTVPSSPDLAVASDTGTSSSDNMTSATTLTFTGTTDAGATVTLYDTDGTTAVGTGTADGAGNWSIATSTLAEGVHSVTARTSDAAGNLSAASAATHVTVDRTAPAASTAPDLDSASDTGVSNTDNITARIAPTFTGTAEANATVTLIGTDGATVLGTATATGAGVWLITSVPLAEGNHTITTKVTDAAGNVSAASAATTIAIDLSAPATTVTGAAFSADTGTSNSDFITRTAAQTISGTLGANLASGESVQVSLDNGGTWHAATAAVGGNTWSYNATLAASGTLQVRVMDAVDNTGPVFSQAYTLDTSAPSLTISSDKSALKSGETATITFTFSDDPGASFTGADVTVSGGVLGALSGTGATRTATFTPDAATNGGAASVSVAAGAYADPAGNPGGAGASPVLAIDTLAPVAPSTPELAPASDTGASGTDRLTSASTLRFTGTAESGASIKLLASDGSTVLGTGTAAGGNWSIDVAGLTEGTHAITAQATDAAGNSGPASGALSVTIDRTAPALAITSDRAALKSGETATITFTFSEDPGTSFAWDGNSGDVVVTGGTLGAISGAGLVRTATFTPATGTNGGTAVVTVAGGAYTDAAGNAGGAGAAPSLVFDTLAPAASMPDLAAASDTGASDSDGISADTTPTFTGTAEANAIVTLYGTDGVTVLGAASADGTGNWTITSSALGAGSHTVTTRVTDAAGNLGPVSAGMSFSIDTIAAAPLALVLDAASDSATAGDGMTRIATPVVRGTAEAGASVTLYATDGSTVLGTASADGTGNWSITSAALADGIHSLTARQVDRAGNVSDASAALALTVDTAAPAQLAAPVLDAASDSAVVGDGVTSDTTPTFTGTAVALAQVNLYAGDGVTVLGTTRADAAGAWSITAAALADGVHGVTARQFDAAGNESPVSAVFSLTVDTAAPAAPAAPALADASDTEVKGDRVTTDAAPGFEGSALPNAKVTLYDGATVIGTATADAAGKWSIKVATLAVGPHTITARQSDAAGNLSDASAVYALRIDPPPAPPASLFDGVPVEVRPVVLPDGGPGTLVEIPIVTASREDTLGKGSVADIPLASANGSTLLLAQVAPGFGLSAIGGTSAPSSTSAAQLIAAINAATPLHSAGDQGHLTGSGQSFLSLLPPSQSLLVQTVKPVSGPTAPAGSLTLSGGTGLAGQNVALVIDTAGLATGSTLELHNVDFAAVIGTASVTSRGGDRILSGDGAGQAFQVSAAGGNAIYAGGGGDTLSFGLPADASPNGGQAASVKPGAGVTLLHGGLGSDVANFDGTRDSFHVETHHGYVVVSSKAAPGQKALVVNAEQLRFSDTTVVLEADAGLATIAALYRTVHGRQADLYGFEFWADAHEQGSSWGTIALHMIASAEANASRGSFDGNAEHDVEILYQALFNRAGDAGGMAFWTGLMRDQGYTLEQVAGHMVQSVEMVGQQRAMVDWDFTV